MLKMKDGKLPEELASPTQNTDVHHHSDEHHDCDTSSKESISSKQPIEGTKCSSTTHFEQHLEALNRRKSAKAEAYSSRIDVKLKILMRDMRRFFREEYTAFGQPLNYDCLL